MSNYTIDELRAFGFDDEQIAAINRVKVNKARANGAPSIGEVIKFEDKQVEAPKKPTVIKQVKEKPVKKYTDSDILTFDKLQDINDSAIVELPPFGDGTPFIARLKRPSMLRLCKQGVIPNSLLNQATSLFTSGNESLSKVSITEIYDICEIMCAASFVNPTYEEITEAGIELTDEQIMAVFQYSQGGVKALENFREQ